MRKAHLNLIAFGAALTAAAGMWWAEPDVHIEIPEITLPELPELPTFTETVPVTEAEAAPVPTPQPTVRVQQASAPMEAVPAATGFHPPPPPTWVDATEVRAAGSMIDVAVGLKEHESRIRDCYSQWSAVHGDIPEKLQFEVNVPAGPQGEVVRPTASTVWALDQGDSLEACVNEALVDLRFAAPEGEQTLVWQIP